MRTNGIDEVTGYIVRLGYSRAEGKGGRQAYMHLVLAGPTPPAAGAPGGWAAA